MHKINWKKFKMNLIFLEHNKMFGLKQFRNLSFLILILFFSACSSKQESMDNTREYYTDGYKKTYISRQQLKEISWKYGKEGLQRVKDWSSMMYNSANKKIFDKLRNVNNFFNKLTYKTDINHWRQEDYWATPFEFMGTGAGDCEDFAIAKYFSLKRLAVPEEKLRINYVIYKRRGTQYDQNHMVLTYFHKPNSTPIVLDNINKRLELASKRTDLKPIYSFNANGLWQNKKKGTIKVGENKLKAWIDLQDRL